MLFKSRFSPDPAGEQAAVVALGVVAKHGHRCDKPCSGDDGQAEAPTVGGYDPDTLAGIARQIERARAERKGPQIRLRRLTTGQGMTEDEIRQVVQNLATAVNLLSSATTADRRRVYEAAQLKILYDHENRRAQLSIAPRVSGGVGGGT